MTPAARKTRSQLRKLIGAKDAATVRQGCEIIMALADDAELRPVIEELAVGTSVSDEGQLIIASTSEVKKRCRAAFRLTVGLHVLAATGALETVEKLGFEAFQTGTPHPFFDVPLESVTILSGCTSLTSLDLSYCTSLKDLTPLAGLTKLTSLNLTRCTSVPSIDVLANFTELTSVILNMCVPDHGGPPVPMSDPRVWFKRTSRPLNVDVLTRLEGLQTLEVNSASVEVQPFYADDIRRYGRLRTREDVAIYQARIKLFMAVRDGDRAFLEGHVTGTSLNLCRCLSLQNVDALGDLTALTSLDLSYCESLQSVDGLANLTALTTLDLSDCHSLQNVDGLANLTALTTLDLRDCYSLQSVDVLANLTALRSLDLSGCRALESMDGLANLALTELSLANSRLLQSADALANLTTLTTLKLGGSTIQSVDALANLTALTELSLWACKSLENVDGLVDLSALTSLSLGHCASLPSSLRQDFRGKERCDEARREIQAQIDTRADS